MIELLLTAGAAVAFTVASVWGLRVLFGRGQKLREQPILGYMTMTALANAGFRIFTLGARWVGIEPVDLPYVFEGAIALQFTLGVSFALLFWDVWRRHKAECLDHRYNGTHARLVDDEDEIEE